MTGTRNNLSKTLATGSKVELYSNSTDTTPFDTIYLSVLGDVTGDGRITASDVAYLRQVANDSQALESMSIEKRLAGMINNKGGITEIDSEILRNYIDKQIDKIYMMYRAIMPLHRRHLDNLGGRGPV